MILVTGGTGFIGSKLVSQLIKYGNSVRLLLHPLKKSPNIPKGLPVEIAVSSLQDEKGIRAALKGVDIIFHLASAEQEGSRADLQGVDILGTTTLASVVKEVNIERMIYLSHLGADRGSAYPLMKAKGIAEHSIKNSEINYTIIRSGVVFGPGDHFTNNLYRLIKNSPGLILLPADGKTLLQPIWIDDLVTCLVWLITFPSMANKIIEIGGPEYLSLFDIIHQIMDTTKKKRLISQVNPVSLRYLTILFESFSKKFPTSAFWVDYLAENRICSLDSVPFHFNLSPTRFSQNLSYLKESII